jgi:RNA polymerase II subunit A C-terminal domain phosphatase SSU72
MSFQNLVNTKQLRNDIKIALVCQSNVNRSMEAHALLCKQNYFCSSFGVGSKVRLPGELKNDPNEYEFDSVTYEHIYQDLHQKNALMYTKNGMLNMIDRDRKCKRGPARWQNEFNYKFDLVIAFEKRVYDLIVSDIKKRESGQSHCVHVLNIDTTDNHKAAYTGSINTQMLVERLYAHGADWEANITATLDALEQEWRKPILHTVMFY